jgi:hypothetical protein
MSRLAPPTEDSAIAFQNRPYDEAIRRNRFAANNLCPGTRLVNQNPIISLSATDKIGSFEPVMAEKQWRSVR